MTNARRQLGLVHYNTKASMWHCTLKCHLLALFQLALVAINVKINSITFSLVHRFIVNMFYSDKTAFTTSKHTAIKEICGSCFPYSLKTGIVKRQFPSLRSTLLRLVYQVLLSQCTWACANSIRPIPQHMASGLRQPVCTCKQVPIPRP